MLAIPQGYYSIIFPKNQEGAMKMERAEYLYNMVKTVYSAMVQSTLTIENFIGVTIVPFNKEVLQFYDEFLSYYEATEKKLGEDEKKTDAVLLYFLRANRERIVSHALKYIEENIINKAGITYDIKKYYSMYESKKTIGNPFEKIIVDLRELAEKKFDEKEVINLRNIDIMWYDEKVLAQLRAPKMDVQNEDGELGGHLMQNKVSYDLSYLSTRSEREQLFREIVLGESFDAK